MIRGGKHWVGRTGWVLRLEDARVFETHEEALKDSRGTAVYGHALAAELFGGLVGEREGRG